MEMRPVGSFLRLSSSFACFLLLGLATTNAQDQGSTPDKPDEPQSYRAGLRSIVIPPPTADLHELGSDYRVLAEGFAPDTNRLIAAFLLAEDAANVHAGVSKPLSHYALVETLRRTEFANIDDKTFKEVTESMAQQFGATLEASMKDQEQELNHKLKAMRGDVATITLDKPVQLGSFFCKLDACGFGTIMPVSTAGSAVKMVTGSTLLRVQNRLLYVFVYAIFKDEDSVQWVRKTSELWADSILDANKQ